MKRALVTGGSGAIGSAICKALAVSGLHVLVHANAGIERAERVVEDIRAQGGSADALQFDVGDRAQCAKLLGVLAEQEPVQIIVHNAGIHDDAPLAGMTGDQWDRVMAVSLDGFYNVTQPLLLPMIRTRWGRVVSISSVAAVMGNRGQVNYAAAKAGLHGATRALSVELASRGITANAIAPGIIESDMSAKFGAEQIAQLVPMKRAGRPEEVAALVAFLASEQAGYISGQIIGVNGAMA